MRCPNCGAHVQEGMDVCPDCETRIEQAGEQDAPTRWCESCGSAIPEGAHECPVCGLPVEGAFDDPSGEGLESAAKVNVDAPELASAIPPAPESGDVSSEVYDAPTRLRLSVVAAIAALLVVGGTALYITRPWDPDAYVTHASTETPVKEDGPQKSISHLSRQDQIEAAERTEYLRNAESLVDELVATMKDVANGCTECEEVAEACFESGTLPDESRLPQVSEYADRLNGLHDQVAKLDLRGSTYEAYAKDVLVTSAYLKGRVETLKSVWESLDAAIDASSGLVVAESKMTNGFEGRSLEEWKSLYDNSFAALEVKKQ